MGILRSVRVAAMTVCTVGGLSGAMYGLLTGQGKRARTLIGRSTNAPLLADGVYPAPGPNPLKFAVLGDSVAAGSVRRPLSCYPACCWPVDWPRSPGGQCG